MYLFEIIIKKIKESREKKKKVFCINADREEQAYKDCASHIYLPIDSAKEYLACKNCGHVIKNFKNFESNT
ncbi:MAG TPA: hypothetical protein P5556_10370 [Candidatus Gastranaerophilales bacterium]|nr:hypothetical protein [Candidatus Gastranaerophilales bacterium]